MNHLLRPIFRKTKNTPPRKHETLDEMSDQKLANIHLYFSTLYVMATFLWVSLVISMFLLGQWVAAITILLAVGFKKHQVESGLSLYLITQEQLHRTEMQQRRGLWGGWIDQSEWNTADVDEAV